jgi:hypothetical protein
MNNTENLARILSVKFPELNPTEDCHCFKLANDGDIEGVINYGLGWWQAQAEAKQAEVNRLNAEVERLRTAGGNMAIELRSGYTKQASALIEGWKDANRVVRE